MVSKVTYMFSTDCLTRLCWKQSLVLVFPQKYLSSIPTLHPSADVGYYYDHFSGIRNSCWLSLHRALLRCVQIGSCDMRAAEVSGSYLCHCDVVRCVPHSGSRGKPSDGRISAWLKFFSPFLDRSCLAVTRISLVTSQN
jgi:hypothetical protein